MRRWVDPEPEPEPESESDEFDIGVPHAGLWSRGRDGEMRCRENDLTLDEH